MKKITIFTMQLKNPGGIERFVSTIAKMFCNEYEVEVVANYGKSSDTLAFSLPKNISLVFLSPTQPQEISMKQLITKLKWHQIPKELKRRSKINFTRNHAFKKYLANFNTDYIITDRALYNNMIKKYYRGTATKIATDHNFHQNNHQYIRQLTKSLKSFDYLVVATKELRDFYRDKIGSTRCHFITNPLDNIPAKKSLLNTKNILSVGRLVPDKDYPTLVGVMAKVHAVDPSIHLTIIGDGVHKSLLQNLIKANNLDNCITLTGWLPQNQIEKYYYDSSLFVMTSKTEAFGLALAEAMSYGLPCIAFDRASGARAQINSTSGILIHDSNQTEMANKILSVLNDQKSLKTFQKTINKEIQQKYDNKIVKKEWLKLLD